MHIGHKENEQTAPSFGAGQKMLDAARRWWHNELVGPPLEIILHVSPRRLKFLGLFTLVGHPLFYWVWGHVWPQNYENLPIRMATAVLGMPLLLDSVAHNPQRRLTRKVFSVAAFFQLPLLFSWMYAMNGHNAVWLASLSGAILIYFHLTDWRIAASGTLVGVLLGQVFAAQLPPAEHGVVLAFGWLTGLLLGMSGANLRRERINHTLTTMGIMAHELRTPLATTNLVVEAIRLEARRTAPGARPEQLEKLAHRLQRVALAMNHHIDTQIANAGLMRLPPPTAEVIDAEQLVRCAVQNYPFRSSKDHSAVEIQVGHNFQFCGTERLFVQVLNNLIENAMRSLLTSSSCLRPGDLTIIVRQRQNTGQIIVKDRGIGIAPNTLARIFEPFITTDQATGHGLGLAYCRSVVKASGGTIRVQSALAEGAAFIITLPAVQETVASAGNIILPENRKAKP